MGPHGVIVEPQCLEVLPGILSRPEQVHVQALVTKPSVEAHDHPVLPAPAHEELAQELRPVVTVDRNHLHRVVESGEVLAEQ